MVAIKVVRGLDIPMEGCPNGDVEALLAPTEVALDLKPFNHLRLQLLVKPGDRVARGQPVVRERHEEGRVWLSPAGGEIKDVVRGEKRSLLSMVIALPKGGEEEEYRVDPLSPKEASRQQLIERFCQGGLFPHIRRRPFNLVATPGEPRAIFIRGLESAPFRPSMELQLKGLERELQVGIDALAKLAPTVHFIARPASPLLSLVKNVQTHTVQGPHPASHSSLHIQEIDPIRGGHDLVWTLSAFDAAIIGHHLLHGTYRVERIVGMGGTALVESGRRYVKTRLGAPMGALLAGRLQKLPAGYTLLSGDPLMGEKSSIEGFLGFYHNSCTLLPKAQERQLLHFFRLGLDTYTFSRTYLSALFRGRRYAFTDQLHGEARPFIDSSLYDKVMPLDIPTMELVKAVMAEDYERAEQLGIFDVADEDFALPSFVCPSKMEMVDIMGRGLESYSREMLG